MCLSCVNKYYLVTYLLNYVFRVFYQPITDTVMPSAAFTLVSMSCDINEYVLVVLQQVRRRFSDVSRRKEFRLQFASQLITRSSANVLISAATHFCASCSGTLQ